jgi:putative oxygen-independent coproporphyrinogen III oxidase
LSAFGIYVHWPFCKAKCPYCDFNSHVRHEAVDSMGFAASLVVELTTLAERLPGRMVSSIFFVGGTPSLMPPAAVAMVLEAIAALWPMGPDAEITLEANPTSVEATHFKGYRAAGVNRVSVGVQSLDAAHLAALGRQHSPAEALAAFELAAGVFPRVSFDMIYARPGQTRAHWERELAQALKLQRGHMSLYQLTVEPDTRFADLHAAGKLVLPDDDLSADLYDLTQQMTAAAGLHCYEVSNHAAPGHESQHNLLYWRYGEYLGVGPGAHGRLHDGNRVHATVAEKHPETWRQRVRDHGHGIVSQDVISPPEQAQELLLMGLRVAEGLDLQRYEALAGTLMPHSKIAALTDLGLLNMVGNHRIVATASGRRVLNALIAELAV